MSVDIMRAALDSGDVFHARPVGKEFIFTAAHGSHRHELWGRIIGVAWSDEGGLKLFVSIPEFGGNPLKCLVQTDKGWCAYVETDDTEMIQELTKLLINNSGVRDDKAENEITQRHHALQFISGKLKVLGS